jgi:hypothetical protein
LGSTSAEKKGQIAPEAVNSKYHERNNEDYHGRNVTYSFGGHFRQFMDLSDILLRRRPPVVVNNSIYLEDVSPALREGEP